MKYGMGAEIERNEIAKNYVNTCADYDLVQGLKLDTLEKRIVHFKTCLDELKKFIATSDVNTMITHYFTTLGVGKSGVVDNTWIKFYLPILLEFADFLTKMNKNLVILCRRREDLPETLKGNPIFEFPTAINPRNAIDGEKESDKKRGKPTTVQLIPDVSSTKEAHKKKTKKN